MCQAAPKSIWRHFHNSATRFVDLSRTATGLSRITPSDESSMSQVFWPPSRGVRLERLETCMTALSVDGVTRAQLWQGIRTVGRRLLA